LVDQRLPFSSGQVILKEPPRGVEEDWIEAMEMVDVTVPITEAEEKDA
jgi:hypothetical protein